MQDLIQAAKATRSWACYDCGKCTASCPVARVGGGLSPRRHVATANSGELGDALQNGKLFQCLTCSLCDQRCPAGIGYVDLVQRLRSLAVREGVEPECPHGGALQSLMRMMAAGGTRQDRLQWLNGALKTTADNGELFYWTGCAVFYDAFFAKFPVSILPGIRAAVALMNKADRVPVVSPEERCCGHDLLWSGDRENFERLARHNVALVERSEAKTLVTSCAECLRTWKMDYEPFFSKRPPRMLHITEFLVEHLGELKFEEKAPGRVAFQDPCRLGRHLGVYEAPRRVLSSVPGMKLVEMPRSGRAATCCAGGTWSNCDRFAKQIQVGRLREVRATGAQLLVTGCPKCQIHFRCAMKDPRLHEEIEIEMKDVATVIAEAIDLRF